MEDDAKIKQIIARLNKETDGDWQAATGFHVMIKADVNRRTLSYASLTDYARSAGELDIRFDTNEGMIVKNFVEKNTGEMRTFHFRKVI